MSIKTKIDNGIYIPDDNRELHTLDEWMQHDDPTTAQTVVLVTDFGALEIAKENLPGEYNFEGAQKAAAEYRKGFRCPTRHEAIEMYDARFRGLDEAFEKIGGQSVDNGLRWTCEEDADPYCHLAFFCYLSAGAIDCDGKCRKNTVRPVRTFKK